MSHVYWYANEGEWDQRVVEIERGLPRETLVLSPKILTKLRF